MLKPDVDAHGGAVGRGRWYYLHVTGEGHVPLVGVAPDGDSLCGADDGAAPLDLEATNAAQGQAPVCEPPSRLVKRAGGVAVIALEARITWLLAGLGPTNEALEG